MSDEMSLGLDFSNLSSTKPHEGDDKEEPATVEQSTISDGSVADEQGMRIDNAELEQIDELVNCIIVITQSDQNYHLAIETLKGEAQVALIVAPFFYGRYHKPSLMLIATEKQIFVFDLLLLGEIEDVLKELLEAKRPRKIIHQSARMNDMLRRLCGVTMNSFIDTLPVYAWITKDEVEYGLMDVIEKVIKVPKSYFAHSVDEKDATLIQARPIADNQLMFYAKKVAFQLKLFNFMLNNLILKETFDASAKTANSYLQI